MAGVNGFGDFSRNMADLALAIEPKAAQIQRKVALAGGQAVTLATPIDTGRARANWQTSLGAPILEPREAYVEGAQGSSSGANTAAALEQQKRAVASHGFGLPIYLTNNVDYIGNLNDGSSAQAPAGFVEMGLQAAVNAVDKEAPDLLRVRRLP